MDSVAAARRLEHIVLRDRRTRWQSAQLDTKGQPRASCFRSLFRPGTDTLLIYADMFPRHKADPRPGASEGETAKLPTSEQPCPSYTGLLDQLNGAAPHYEAGGANFAVVANTSLDRLAAVARDRKWTHLHFLSTAGNGFKRDYYAEDKDGQLPMILVFKRDADKTIRLFWASEVHAKSDPGQDHRAAGTIEPFWNMFDLGPHGRPDFHEQLNYDCCGGAQSKR